MYNLQQLKIENFGPIITTGDKPLEFKRCTVLIGDQGTGKSTIVKLLSTLTWLEKAILSKRVYNTTLTFNDINGMFERQNIPKDYFVKKTKIYYESNVLLIKIEDLELSIKKKNGKNNDYICPKIQYVPSERNLLSIADDLDKISGIPEMLIQYNAEFKIAKKNIKDLKFQNFKFRYDKKNDFSFVETKKTKIKVKLQQASSGIQSIFPMLFVSKYLSSYIKSDIFDKLINLDNDRRSLFLENIKNETDKNIIYNYIQSGIKTNLKKVNISDYIKEANSIINSCFIEIVEEPEQNLFPTSQVEILKNIVEDTSGENDKLIMTTHSPYVLSQINNYIFAKSQNDIKNITIKEIPSSLYINYNDTSAYKIVNGYVNGIMDEDYGGIDVNEIDECSRNITKVFDKLFS